MKKDTVTKLKFKKLKRRIAKPFYIVVGLLESLWFLTQANAPVGDIGKLSNEEIAAGMEWEGDADELIGILVDCRWLDDDPEFRLVVHNWSKHVPTYLNAAFKKHGKLFADEIVKARLPSTVPGTVPRTIPSTVPGTMPTRAHADLTYPSLSYPSLTNPPPPSSSNGANTARARPSGPTTQNERGGGGNSQAGEERAWGVIVSRLKACGVKVISDCIRECKSAGYAPEQAGAVLDVYVAKPGRWDAGALYFRLTSIGPDIAPAEGWAEPSPQAVKQVDRDQREATRSGMLREAAERERKAQAERDRRVELEHRHGEALDRLLAQDARGCMAAIGQSSAFEQLGKAAVKASRGELLEWCERESAKAEANP